MAVRQYGQLGSGSVMSGIVRQCGPQAVGRTAVG
jgi:hypothetical protein